MHLFYASTKAIGSTAVHRLWALRRNIAEVTNLSYDRYLLGDGAPPGWTAWVERTQLSPEIAALNGALLAEVERSDAETVWLDKPIYIYPRTVERLARQGRKVAAYMPDDPFGPRRDGVWRHLIPAIPYYYGHAAPRPTTRQEYLEQGAQRVTEMLFSFEPSIHVPPETLGLPRIKDIDVSFVGYPHDARVKWLTDMARALPGRRIAVFGPGWSRHADQLADLGVLHGGPLWNDQYRDLIWRSRMSVSFVTRSNRDVMSRKAIEIAACGTVPLVEPSPVHDRVFEHGVSALFFEAPGALPDIVREHLADEDRLEAVGKAAAKAVRKARLDNDSVLERALKGLELI